ncbi:MAG TPA: OmpA family protein [Polyangia bacterium]|nr:OmpA family protein [Polyangia bacterium]
MNRNGEWRLGWLLLWVAPLSCATPASPPVERPHSIAVVEPAARSAPRLAGADKADNGVDTGPPSPNAVFFDFDSAMLKDEARESLATAASNINRRHASQVTVEGNCDELGTVEYNLALGQQRAEAAKDYLVRMGVPSQRIRTASYGSQRPRYPGHDDVSRAKNRRDDLSYR